MRQEQSTSRGGLLFLVRSLNYGGSERQIITLVKELSHRGESLAVVTFYSGGALLEDLEKEGVQVFSLCKRGRWDVFGFFRRFVQLIRNQRPEILCSYLVTPNLISLAGKLILPRVQVVWGIRASNMDLAQYGWLHLLLYRFERMLSRFSDIIIVNSYAGFNYAIANGFARNKMVVIPNGVDTIRFSPTPFLREKIRTEWKVSDQHCLIGLIGRLDPMKDHDTFLRAAALIWRDHQDARFVCIGEGEPFYRMKLQALSSELGLNDCLIWSGFRSDMGAVYNALDIACSSSAFGEGFSNAISEAMACGVPCIVTDVGDSAWIVGETGEVVSAKDPKAFAAGLKQLMFRVENNPSLGLEARQRIEQNFRVELLVNKTSKLIFKRSEKSEP